ncbi:MULTISPECIES: bifunctional helix-turn-helix transcriptional regulator/GNAT family N-acetyltransferase [unclassified Pseudomonas]|uniref:bifunctional helix-turn-helix transcriptional regulator/GNAT family N-acetyltransferase n=1 Tax=unclassified Pseudomonas TaxID=196821 RepID=UPI000536BAEE|nr:MULTISPECIES: bifunctional helix-turn-helix transcriptional regulator/GNAT family N-acetyltransferase [unclassified Pseudomonas]MBD0687709.1 MarR family transcriptional regulator [Pseudomonas sp. PSB18]CDF92172.1 Transcriptional regulator, MarR family / Acetyltransferase (GNAT) [Pseudomonas sp. SHC52]
MDHFPQGAINHIRSASRLMVRELGFMNATLAATAYPPSSVHAIVEIGNRQVLTAAELVELLGLEKSSVSRMVRKLIEAGELEEIPNEADARSKHLRLTAQGADTLRSIDRFATQQVEAAMSLLTEEQRRTVREGIAHYAVALRAHRLGTELSSPAQLLDIARGYRPGIIGRIVQMHADYYARHSAFGQPFESLVASDMAELMGRLHNPRNEVWVALEGERIVGSIAIDGEGEGGEAILRCFILDDCARGKGAGRRLLAEAMKFCDQWQFPATRLWTFQGLDAARRLYEDFGFRLEHEQEGQQWGRRVMEQCFVRPFL